RQKVTQIVDALDEANYMILNIAEVRMHGSINQRHVEPHHAVAHFLQRLDRAAQQQQFVSELVNSLDIGSTGIARKDTVLQCVHFGFELLQDGEIVVDDEIHDRINDETLAHRQHL